MSKIARVFFSAFCGCALVMMLALVSPITTKAQGANGDEKMGQQTNTVTGTVTSAKKDLITVKLGPDANVTDPYKKFQIMGI